MAIRRISSVFSLISTKPHAPTMLKYLSGLLLIASSVYGEMMMDSPTDDAEAQLLSLHQHWKSHTVHFLLAVLLITLVPSVSAVYATANRFRVSLLLQAVSLGWTVMEFAVGFTDPSGHESRASKGTNVFMVFFIAFTIVNGCLALKDQLVTLYKIFSGLCVLVGMIRLGMGVVSMLSFCYDSHTGQCNAHGIMGMSFIVYGFYLSVVLVVPWIRINSGKFSQEFYDSMVITVWGIINTFTEHRPWEPWSHGDYQHTSMGIIFWCAGMLGVWLSLGRKRNFVPALTMIFTGYAMSEHVQETIISTKVHGFFGTVLIFGGMARIFEICFLLDDKDSKEDKEIRSFQYLAPFSLVLGGLLFMCANEEQLVLVINLGADHSSYILSVSSGACIIQLWILMMLQLYLTLVKTDTYKPLDIELEEFADHEFAED